MHLTKRLVAMLAALIIGAIGAVAPAAPAAADSESEFPTCRYDQDVIFFDTGLGYAASGWRTKPATGCEDINAGNLLAGLSVRVRFCPSNGSPCYPNSWKPLCTYCVVEAATNVRGGTRYRLEVSTTRTWFLDVWD